jgi:hypothetical protein
VISSILAVPSIPAQAAASPSLTYKSQVLGDAHIHQAARLYRAVLAREADHAGASYWGELLADGYAIEAIAKHLLASEEYRNRSVGDHVVDTYVGALGRMPEPAGHAYWSEFEDRSVVVVAISDSVEHQQITDTLPPPSRVRLAPKGWVNAGHGVFVPPVLLDIRFCESRGDYTAANPRSSARGAYQFLRGSWAAYGHAARYGVATADRATPAQQDQAALITWQADGTRPWNASRHCWG